VEQIMNELMEFFGVFSAPATFLELILWFVRFSFGCCLFRYVLYSVFWLTSQFNKGVLK